MPAGSRSRARRGSGRPPRTQRLARLRRPRPGASPSCLLGRLGTSRTEEAAARLQTPLAAQPSGTWNRADAELARSGRCSPPWIYSARWPRSERSACRPRLVVSPPLCPSRAPSLPLRARHPGAAREPAVRTGSGAAPRSPEPAAPPRPACALPPLALRAPRGAPPAPATAGVARRAPELPAVFPFSARRIVATDPRPIPPSPGVRGAGSAVAMAARRDSVWKYCWGVLMVLCRTAMSRSIVLEPIYWNSSNSK